MRTLLALLLLLPVAGPAAQPPNVVFVFVDNLGYGDIAPFGSKINRTPHLDRMALEGRKFTHFYAAAGVCTPSRAAAMTGCYPPRVGLHHNERDQHVLRPVSPHGLHPDEITVAEILRGRGYATTCIGKWHLGDQPDFLPTRQGFDSYYGIPYSDDMTPRVWKETQWPALPLVENEGVAEAPARRELLTERYTRRAVEFMEAQTEAGKPFFLYLPHATPGSTPVPHVAPRFEGRSKHGSWSDAVEELDWSQGEVLGAIRRLGIEKDTLVIWTSDNGGPTSFYPGNPRRANLGPLHGNGYSSAEGGFRVPMIAWWPSTIPAGTECAEPCSTMDLLPSFAKLAGGKVPDDRIIDGRDIGPLLLGEKGATSPHEAFYYYAGDQLHAVRSGTWKLFASLNQVRGRHGHLRPDAKTPTEPLLFHLVDDPGSKNNVAAKHPDIVDRLTGLAAMSVADLGTDAKPGPGRRPLGTIDGKAMALELPEAKRNPLPSEWTPIFNGKDLDGWEGRSGAWEVVDGAISCAGTEKTRNWLIWRGGRPGDFELRLEYRFARGNSGVQIRSRELENFTVRGYQVEVAEPRKMGLWHHSISPIKTRSHLATAGLEVVLDFRGRRTEKRFAEAVDLQAKVRADDWNTIHVRADGPRIVQSVNGVVFADLTDEDRAWSTREGWIALQDHGKGTQVEFRKIEIRALAE